MNNYIYTLYNKLSLRYGQVNAFPSDAFAIKRTSELLGKDCDEYELCRVGSIDIETGIITAENPTRLILSNPDKLPTKQLN